jgi:hypothetical protein
MSKNHLYYILLLLLEEKWMEHLYISWYKDNKKNEIYKIMYIMYRRGVYYLCPPPQTKWKTKSKSQKACGFY